MQNIKFKLDKIDLDQKMMGDKVDKLEKRMMKLTKSKKLKNDLDHFFWSDFDDVYDFVTF